MRIRVALDVALVVGVLVMVPASAKFGAPNTICFSGNRKGMSAEQGLENCAIGLKRIMPLAEKHKVTLCMELLNSRVNHKDYMCDTSVWGVELVKRVGSERFKLLYDIYHMQIMEGDLIATIKKNYESYRPLSHCGRSRPQRNRRLAGNQLSRRDESDCGHRLQRIRCAGIYSETRGQNRVAETRRADLRRLNLFISKQILFRPEQASADKSDGAMVAATPIP